MKLKKKDFILARIISNTSFISVVYFYIFVCILKVFFDNIDIKFFICDDFPDQQQFFFNGQGRMFCLFVVGSTYINNIGIPRNTASYVPKYGFKDQDRLYIKIEKCTVFNGFFFGGGKFFIRYCD